MLKKLWVRFAISILTIAAPLAAQTDGEWHGDAPYLLEDGWKPLLTGKDVSGWHARDKKNPFAWFTTRGVRWEPVLSPKLLSGVPAPGGLSGDPVVTLVSRLETGGPPG